MTAFNYFDLKSHTIFEFTNDKQIICVLWEFKQEINMLASIPLKDYRDFQNVGRKIASIEREASQILKK